MNVPFVDLRRQYRTIDEEMNQAALKVLESGRYMLGGEVDAFEEEMAAYCGVRHAVGVNSGTDAIALALLAAGIGAGHEVITVSHTFFATVEAIHIAGATPVLVDIEEQSMTMDVSAIEPQITPRTRAIIPVHMNGHPADMVPILDIAERHGLVVIEDACQAVGARYHDRMVGSIGHAACFSFMPSKNLGACGDGGMIVTDDKGLADTARMLGNHGSHRKYYHERLGYNSRLDAIQAALLRVKLKHIDTWNQNRNDRAQLYSRLLQDSQVRTPWTHESVYAVYHLYVVRNDKRDQLQTYLKNNGIESIIHYPIPIHLQKATENSCNQSLPVTERTASTILSLPMFAEMSEDEVHQVVNHVKTFEPAV